MCAGSPPQDRSHCGRGGRRLRGTQSRRRASFRRAPLFLVLFPSGIALVEIHYRKELARGNTVSETLRESELWFRHIFQEAAVGMVILDGAGSIRSLNRGFTDITLYSAAELQAMHDQLTGLPNRRQFEEVLDISLALARNDALKNATGGEVAILYVDLDGFKLVNDTMGHHSGDLLLKEVARRIRKYLDDSAFLARVGGDEFTVGWRDWTAPRFLRAWRKARWGASIRRLRLTAGKSALEPVSASAGTRWMETIPTCCCKTPIRRCTTQNAAATIGISSLPRR